MFSISTPFNLFLCGTQFCSVMCYLNALLHFLSVCKKASWRDQCEDHSQVSLKEVTNLTKVNEFNKKIMFQGGSSSTSKCSMIQSSRILRYTIHIRACEWLNLYLTILLMRLIYNMAEKKPLTEGDLEMETDLILQSFLHFEHGLKTSFMEQISLVNAQKSLVYVPAMNMFQ